MKVNPTGRLPGYREHCGDTVEEVRPQLVEHNGQPYLVVHAPDFTTGVIRPVGTSGDDDRVVLTIWADRAPGAPVAMALTFTPDDDAMDTIIQSLTGIRDTRRAAANARAAAALRKAAGK